jgi:hypothetical protein
MARGRRTAECSVSGLARDALNTERKPAMGPPVRRASWRKNRVAGDAPASQARQVFDGLIKHWNPIAVTR